MKNEEISIQDVPSSDELNSTNSECFYVLYCIHHAGGAASAFRPWQSIVNSRLRLSLIQFPGREDRINDTMFAHLDEMVTVIAQSIIADCPPRFAIFGHSMGALAAYLIGKQLLSSGIQPQRLIVSCCRPPNIKPLPYTPALEDDRALLREIGKIYGGIPDEIFHYPEMVQHSAKVLRADINLLNSYTPPVPPYSDLAIPINVFYGKQDNSIDFNELTGWRLHTSASCTFQAFNGGHFYFHDNANPIADALTAICLNKD
ncbi:thioesterase II family protein [Kosakonia quasisacchari]|nr:alpha/beta fold hydrolase [Kosakonia quasisacchari]